MPYINQTRRAEFAQDAEFSSIKPETVGELNYVITKLVLEYLPTTPSYNDYNSVVGVLESAKLEFYRRAVAEYENQKIFDNGDVYTPMKLTSYKPPISLVMEGNTSDG